MDAQTLDRPADRRSRTPDAVCAAAIDLARAAAAEEAGSEALVGEHLGSTAVAERVVVHRFRNESSGYVGWVWAVSLVRASRARVATVAEAWCEPGDGALLAPPWQPWAQRVRPGDLGAGDVFPTPADEPGLAPGFAATDELVQAVAADAGLAVAWSVGLGRVRVLSAEGRDHAADRWHAGEGGPRSPLATSAPARCASCGWLLTIGGPLGQAFGICAHVMSPSDGHVVSLDHGCGAHSEVVAEAAGVLVMDTVLDEVGYDSLELVPEPALADLQGEPVAQVAAGEPVAQVAAGEPVAGEPAGEPVAGEPVADDVDRADYRVPASPDADA